MDSHDGIRIVSRVSGEIKYCRSASGAAEDCIFFADGCVCGAGVAVSQREAVHAHGGVDPWHQRRSRAAQQKGRAHEPVGHHSWGCSGLQRSEQARCSSAPGQAAAKRGVQQAQLLSS